MGINSEYKQHIEDMIGYIEAWANQKSITFEEAAARCISTVWGSPSNHMNHGGQLFQYLLVESGTGGVERRPPSRYSSAKLHPTKAASYRTRDHAFAPSSHCGCLTEVSKIRRNPHADIFAGVIIPKYQYYGPDNPVHTVLPIKGFAERVADDPRVPSCMQNFLSVDGTGSEFQEMSHGDFREMSREEVLELLQVFAHYQQEFDTEARELERVHL